jgi:hypothetical protein
MDVTDINSLCEVLVNVQTAYFRLQLIISIQLDLTADSLPPDPTNTYLRLILRLMYVHRFQSVLSFTYHLTYSARTSLPPNCTEHVPHSHLTAQHTYLTPT